MKKSCEITFTVCSCKEIPEIDNLEGLFLLTGFLSTVPQPLALGGYGVSQQGALGTKLLTSLVESEKSKLRDRGLDIPSSEVPQGT